MIDKMQPKIYPKILAKITLEILMLNLITLNEVERNETKEIKC